MTSHPTLRRQPRAFTLVELLTVIAIITLLIGILIPALNAVRRAARETDTKSTLNNSIATALETFKGDGQIGGAYPPSASDYQSNLNGTGALTYTVANPFGPGTGGGGPNVPPGLRMTGAGLLYFALMGADGNGTPGFKTFRSTSRYWSQDTDNRTGANSNQNGAYALNATTRVPVRTRYGPYVEKDKARVSILNRNAGNTGGNQHFEIEAESRAAEALGVQKPQRQYPMFLDSFGGPVLYFRADAAGIQAADNSPSDNEVTSEPDRRGRYHFRDNAPLLEAIDGSTPLVLTPNNRRHPLRWQGTTGYVPLNYQMNTILPTLGTQHPFYAYIRSKSASANLVPVKQDSYLLISAGEDGLFGTADDITNFEHNGAELVGP